MKKKLYLFLILPFMFSCASNPDSTNVESDNTKVESNETKVDDKVIIEAEVTPEKLVLFESKEGLFGYKNEKSGEIVIEAKYQIADEFENGISQVVGETGWEVIDQSGNMLFKPFLFDNGPDSFQDDLARFVKNDKIGFYNKYGKVIVKPEYDFANPFERGYASACKGCQKEMMGEHYMMKGGQWGFIDLKGNEIAPFKYQETKVATDGTLQALNGETWEAIKKP